MSAAGTTRWEAHTSGQIRDVAHIGETIVCGVGSTTMYTDLDADAQYIPRVKSQSLSCLFELSLIPDNVLRVDLVIVEDNEFSESASNFLAVSEYGVERPSRSARVL